MTSQRSLRSEVLFQGIGVHSGAPCLVRVRPAPAGQGIVLKNPAYPEDLIHVGRSVPEEAMHATVLRGRHWAVSTVEHLLAALWMVGIDNAELVVQGGEIPILDGSAYPFLYRLNRAGTVEQQLPRQLARPRREIAFEHKGKILVLTPLPVAAKATLLEYEADFGPQLEGKVGFAGELEPGFLRDFIAPARTFGFLSQLGMLRSLHLSQGSSLGNTVVFDDGAINDQRMAAEYLHHKILDLLGDLFLLGHGLQANIKAAKTGHSFNRLVVKHYVEHPEDWELATL